MNRIFVIKKFAKYIKNRKTSDSFGDSDIKNQKRWKKQKIDKMLIFRGFLTV